MPKEVTAAKLKKGEMTTSEVKKGMLALKWQDKRAVVMLSTIHDDSRVTKRRRTRLVAGGIEEVQKPTMVEKYNMYMGGADKGDQLMSYYGFSHRTVKWWRRAFFHLFENAIVNAYIYTDSLYRMGVKWTTTSLGLSSPTNFLQTLTIKLALLAVISMLSLLQLD